MSIPLAALSLLTGSVAHATSIDEPFDGNRPHTLELHAGFAWYGVGLAAGVRYGIPLVKNGFIKELNNSVYLSFGADIYTVSAGRYVGTSGIGLGVPVVLQWNFYFTDDWSAFGEAGINVYVDTNVFQGNNVLFGASWVSTSIGGRYQLSESLALIGRLGSPYASIGIQLDL